MTWVKSRSNHRLASKPSVVAASRQSAAFFTQKAQMAALCRDAATGCRTAVENEAWLDARTKDPRVTGGMLPLDFPEQGQLELEALLAR